MADSSDQGFSLSISDVLRRQARREAIAIELSRLHDEQEEIDRWLNAVSIIFPKAAQLQQMNSQADAEEKETRSPVQRAILATLQTAPQGLAPREIAQALREGDDAEVRQRISDNPNAHYNALERMAGKGRLIKHGECYFTPDHYSSLPEEERESAAAAEHNREGMPAFVLSLFSPGVAMSPQDINEAVRKDPFHSVALERNSGIVYSAINRLYKRKKLVRDGSYYVLAPEKNEPSDASPSNGSEAGAEEKSDGLPAFLMTPPRPPAS